MVTGDRNFLVPIAILGDFWVSTYRRYVSRIGPETAPTSFKGASHAFQMMLGLLPVIIARVRGLRGQPTKVPPEDSWWGSDPKMEGTRWGVRGGKKVFHIFCFKGLPKLI